jgi:hypothetical protein
MLSGTRGGFAVDLPVSDEAVLAELYAWKREYAEKLHAATLSGDMQTRHALRIRMREIKSLILERGGNFDS